MAEAVLEFAVEKLSSLILNELALLLGVDQDMKRLSSNLTAIKATLEDAEEKQLTNSAIKDWLQKLKDAAYILDDILDEYATEALELQNNRFRCRQPNKVQCSWLFSFHPKHVVFRHKIGKKMRKVKERLDDIAEERNKFHLREIVKERRTEVLDWRQTTSIITQPHVYGREEDKDRILDFLVGDASNFEYLTVYPVVGIGGLGKTTLAQVIFNHERVVSHFELRVWVCVSEDFDLKRISKAIIKSASGFACEDMDLDQLQRRIQELLGRKKYLLVLDDVWNDDQEHWDRLKYVLACGAKGASILVTTRLTKVASIMGTMPPHQLSMLCENDCWEVFKQRAFGINEEERAELVVIGKEIVKKCGGVPLAAKTLGGLLRFKREEKEWLYVKERKLWGLSQDDNSVMAALRLSYLNLPVKLRQCFSYCALFPKDAQMRKQFLIELWMANGFISSNESLKVEDVGDEVWNELYWRSFFQDIEKDEYGNITSFKMHDLVHDVAQSVADGEVCCITDDNGTTNLPARTRHLSICMLKPFVKSSSSLQLNHFKSLKTCITEGFCVDELLPYIWKCYSLRVLETKGLKKVSSSIGHLRHLRYLNLSYGSFKTLSKSLCRLKNLEILNLDYCFHLQKLPKYMKHMKSLRHLYLKECRSLHTLPPDIGEITSLQTLNMFFVGKKRGFLLSELRCLNLKGKLHINQLERVTSLMDAQEANMGSKQLNDLLLSWSRNQESQSQENVEEILEVLQPSTQQLTTFGVGGYMGTRFPQWISSSSLKHLKSVELVDCKRCLYLPSLGKLPSLKKLAISNMDFVQYIDNELYDGGVAGGFVALEFLILENLPNLVKLSRQEGENMFQRLSTLQLNRCPKLSLSCLPSLRELRISGECNHYLLSSIHKLHSLESLWFQGNKELTSFPYEMLRDLTSLKILVVFLHPKLETLPTEMVNLTAIQELCISYCDQLEPLTEHVLQGLHSLKKLEIRSCHKFNLCAGFQYLTALEDLIIENCPEVEGFPDDLQHMTALQDLTLCDLPNLRRLPDWLGNLGLLHSLFISNCPKLMYLPSSIHGLSTLKSLSILSCPELEKRCEKERGEDWPKIVHIEHITLEKHPGYRGGRGGFFDGATRTGSVLDPAYNLYPQFMMTRGVLTSAKTLRRRTRGLTIFIRSSFKTFIFLMKKNYIIYAYSLF